jgi:hypothetical protein
MTRVEGSDLNHLILLFGRLGQFKGLANPEPLEISKTVDVHSLALSKNTATTTTRPPLSDLVDLRTISFWNSHLNTEDVYLEPRASHTCPAEDHQATLHDKVPSILINAQRSKTT